MAERKMPKQSDPDYSRLVDRLTVQVTRVAEVLERIEEHARPTRWYEVTWVDQDAQAYGRARQAMAIEAATEVAARATFKEEADAPGTPIDFGRCIDVKVRLLRPTQCKYCCSAAWQEDGDRCMRCGNSEEEAIGLRREGRFDWHYRG